MNEKISYDDALRLIEERERQKRRVHQQRVNALLWHRDGIAWHEAPRPFIWHRHRVQTAGFGAYRCRCGAFKEPVTGWVCVDSPRVRRNPFQKTCATPQQLNI